MADIDETNRTGGSIRDRMKRESEARAQATREAQQKIEDIEDFEEDVLEDDEEPEKSKINIKLIAGIGAACLVVGVIVMMMVFGSKKEPEPEVVEQPIEQLPVVEEPIVEETETVVMANYTADQMTNLRSIGITAEELDNYMKNNVPYDYIYNTLMEQYWGWHLMNELPTYDMTSAEYKNIIDQTWMSLPERHDLAEWTEDYLAYSYDVKANLDYEKVTPYGNQLFLKIYLDDNNHNSWFFLNIRPEEWQLLGDKGNVVVKYTYQTHYKPYENIFDAEEDKNNIFITAATLDIIDSDFALDGSNNTTEDEGAANQSTNTSTTATQ